MLKHIRQHSRRGTESRTGRHIKQAVRRNRGRFPEDFLFVLTPDETEALVSQSVIPGHVKEDAVMERVDAQGRVIGFSVMG